jgi:peptidoglycan/LPS O-acetylase OafA/YrhL
VPKATRYRNLDGLRGIAALVVLLHHGLLPIPDVAGPIYDRPDAGAWGWYIYSPLHVLTAGTEAVLVFFILSGFVLTLPVLRAAKFDWLSYYPARVIRLYLPVIAAIVFAVALVLILPRMLGSDPSPWMRDHSGKLAWTTPLTDAFLLAGTSNLDGPLWSLRWEVLFSLLLPVYVWVGIRLAKRWLLLTVVISVLVALVSILDLSALQYLLVFAVGVLFATGLDGVTRSVARINASPRHALWWLLITVFGVVALTANWTLGPHLAGRSHGIGQFFVVLGAAAFVYVAFGSALAIRMLTTRPVQWLGAISFSLYLTHEPIVVAVAQLLPTPADHYTIFIATPISLLVGWGFARLVERPSLHLSRAVKHAVAGRRSARAAGEEFIR